MIPLVFNECRGWLHPAQNSTDKPSGAAVRGVVLCGAHGFEELCSRASLRLLAEDLAAHGLPTIRFDWRGTADSAGNYDDPQRVEAWLADIKAAAQTLIAKTGVQEIVLMGLRLGALLAMEAARDLAPKRLVLLAPPASGKAFGREIAVMSRMFQSAEDAALPAFDGVSVAGFRIARATLDDLALVGSRRFSGAENARTLLLSQNENSPLAQKLRDLGGNIETDVFAGYAEMMCSPSASLPPTAALRRIVAFACAETPEANYRQPSPPAQPIAPDDGVLTHDGWTEKAVCFGEQNRLTGILCAPRANAVADADAGPKKVVVFLNAGGVHHIGWARMAVDMARGLAKAGTASLRVDVSGVGDSLSPHGPLRAPLYTADLKQDVKAAIDWLETEGHKEITLFGACSGAYQAFHAAIGDSRVKKLALVNQLCFLYGPTYAMQIEAWRRTKSADMSMKFASAENMHRESPGGARQLMFNLAKKLAKAGLIQATDAAFAVRRAVPGLNIVERWFGELAERGADVLLIYSDNDPGLKELQRHLGARSALANPLPHVQKTTIPDADHEVTQSKARQALSEALAVFVNTRAA